MAEAILTDDPEMQLLLSRGFLCCDAEISDRYKVSLFAINSH
jgi:hypothetical protein